MAASINDTDGLYGITGGTGGSSQYNNKRTLVLTNGQVIWDIAGNVSEWTDQTITGNQPGLMAESEYSLKDWNSSGLKMNGLSQLSRPESISATTTIWNWNSGAGYLFSSSTEVGTSGFRRGGNYGDNLASGVLSLFLYDKPSDGGPYIGFRVAR